VTPSPIYIAAATATGKTALALELARLLPAEIVNADAFQLYAGLPICTAQPTVEEQVQAPHHLFGTLSPRQSFDAGSYHALAAPVIADILARGRWPIVVGGSGLYLKSLTHGLAKLPKANATLRAELAARSPAERVQWLLQLDPDAAENVPLSNDRYVSRALEICLLTGQPQSQLRQQWRQAEPKFCGMLLQRDRQELVQRIDARVHSMVSAGLIDEVQVLLQLHGLPLTASEAEIAEAFPTANKAIGLRQIAGYLAGRCSVAEALAEMQLVTRQYAKRQSTWFRREVGFRVVGMDPSTDVAAVAEQWVADLC
jgi:tRNA dimethylallyltransferase